MIHLHSPMPIEDCVQKLEAGIDSPWNIGGRRPVIGTLNRNRLLVRKRLPMLVGNSFQPHLSATLQSAVDGTTISCKFILHPLVLAFMAVWTTFVVLFGLVPAPAAIRELSQPIHSADAWMGAGIPAGMLAFAVILVGGGWLLSASDKDFLLGFVQRILGAVVLTEDR